MDRLFASLNCTFVIITAYFCEKEYCIFSNLVGVIKDSFKGPYNDPEQGC